jgi:hypothetical protein
MKPWLNFFVDEVNTLGQHKLMLNLQTVAET